MRLGTAMPACSRAYDRRRPPGSVEGRPLVSGPPRRSHPASSDEGSYKARRDRPRTRRSPRRGYRTGSSRPPLPRRDRASSDQAHTGKNVRGSRMFHFRMLTPSAEARSRSGTNSRCHAIVLTLTIRGHRRGRGRERDHPNPGPDLDRDGCHRPASRDGLRDTYPLARRTDPEHINDACRRRPRTRSSGQGSTTRRRMPESCRGGEAGRDGLVRGSAYWQAGRQGSPPSAMAATA